MFCAEVIEIVATLTTYLPLYFISPPLCLLAAKR